MTHNLKTDPDVFAEVRARRKLFEFRREDDRRFEIGDTLRLQETRYSAAEMATGKPLEFTGDNLCMEIQFILRGPAYGVPEGFVIMS